LSNGWRWNHPGIRLQLFESMSGYLVELLCNGRLDMAILFRDAESSGVAIRPLFSEYLSVFGAPGVGDPEASIYDLSLLSGVPLVLPGLSNGLRLLVERAFLQSNAELNVVAGIDSLPVMLALTRNGAVATTSSRAVSMVARPQILARRLINPTISRPVCLCHPTAILQTAASLAVEETIRTPANTRLTGTSWASSCRPSLYPRFSMNMPVAAPP
jgi:LysR family transcriptional regulator, nitrogen assimilation regulatory protein